MSPIAEPLADPAAEAIAQRTAAIVLSVLRSDQVPSHTDTILTRPEARAYVKRRSEAAFCDWCKHWAVRPKGRGRYSRHQLDLALAREAGTARTPATLRR